MSSRVDLGEFLQAFLGEADEHLGHANAQLLAIDAGLKRGEPVGRQVRELFRALHTIKGLSAMVGVDPIVAIAHRMETVLRAADRTGGRLPSGSVDVLLQGIRAIEQRVRALHSGTAPAAPPQALLDALDALESDAPPVARGKATPLELDPAIAAKLGSLERDAIASGVAQGKRAISARFTPSAALAQAGISINSVREKLGAIADIVKVVPIAMTPTASAPAGLAFGLVALTTSTDDALAAAVGLDAASITVIAEAAEGLPVTSEMALLPPEDADDDAGVRRVDMVRVEVRKLDDALERLSALIVSRSRLSIEIARLSSIGIDTRNLLALAREQGRQLRDLRGSILRLRMVPLTEVLDRVPLIVRGLRRSTGKSVRLEIDVGHAELDKAVAERIFPAIIHLVRNAVDHGLESPAARVAVGKNEEGTLRIECTAVGNAQLELRIADDGRGIDRVELARRAGAAVPETEAAVMALLCRPGLSTRDEASDTSGRGMGMDIVRRVVVEDLGGQLTVRSELGHGTTFSLRVPLTISIVDAFTFECGAQRFAVPLSTIDEIVELEPAAIATGPIRTPSSAGTVGVLARRGRAMAVLRLDEVLGLPAASAVAHPKGLVVRLEGDSVAFVVDRMLGQQEIVVRALADPLVDVTGIAGATDLGDGRPTLIVDLMALSALHLGQHTTANVSIPKERLS